VMYNVIVTATLGQGTDYESGTYSAIFSAGEVSTQFSISIIDDDLLEYYERFTLTINSSSTLDGVLRSEATVLIIDNDCKYLLLNLYYYIRILEIVLGQSAYQYIISLSVLPC